MLTEGPWAWLCDMAGLLTVGFWVWLCRLGNIMSEKLSNSSTNQELKPATNLDIITLNAKKYYPALQYPEQTNIIKICIMFYKWQLHSINSVYIDICSQWIKYRIFCSGPYKAKSNGNEHKYSCLSWWLLNYLYQTLYIWFNS